MPDFTCKLKQFRLAKGQYNPSLKLAVDISRTVEAPIEEIFIFE